MDKKYYFCNTKKAKEIKKTFRQRKGKDSQIIGRGHDGGSDLPRARDIKVDTVPVAEQVRWDRSEPGEKASGVGGGEQESEADVRRPGAGQPDTTGRD